MSEPGAAVTEDVFLGGLLSILQPERGYRAGLDAVLLAAAIGAVGGDRVLDAGAGVGVVGLCVAARVLGARVTLVERDPELQGLATANADRNALADRVAVIGGDVEAAAAVLSETGLVAGQFDHVAANPPFLTAGRGREPADPLKAVSHVMPAGRLEAWGRFLVRMARDGGTVTMIHRADALLEVLDALTGRFGAIDVRPVQPRADLAANRILVRGIKGSRRDLRLLPPLVLHPAQGNGFLPSVDAILRRGAALGWVEALATDAGVG